MPWSHCIRLTDTLIPWSHCMSFNRYFNALKSLYFREISGADQCTTAGWVHAHQGGGRQRHRPDYALHLQRHPTCDGGQGTVYCSFATSVNDIHLFRAQKMVKMIRNTRLKVKMPYGSKFFIIHRTCKSWRCALDTYIWWQMDKILAF